jgi:hypothetical protein
MDKPRIDMDRSKEHAPTPYPSTIFTFRLVVESTKEFGGVSHGIRALVEIDPLIGEFLWHRRGPVN